jgi:MFS family permease
MLANLGSQMAALAVPLLVLAGTGSPAWAGAVGSVSAAATLISLLPGGAIADAIERRRLMMACELTGAGAAVTMAWVTFTGHATVPVVLPVAMLSAILGSIYGPAASALLRAAVPGDQLGAATSYLQARSAAARLGGPLLGGALFGISPALPFAAQAGGLLVSCGCLAAVRTRAAATGTAGVLSPRALFAGLAFLRCDPFLRIALAIAGTGLNSAFGAVLLAAIASAARHDPSGRSSGLVVAFAGAGALAGSLVAPFLRAQERTRASILIACWVCAASVFALALVSNIVAVALLVASCTLPAAVANIAFSANMLLATPDDLVGRVQATAGFISMIFQPVGPLAGGLLLSRIGERATFTALAAALACGALAATRARGLRQIPSGH